MKFILHSKKHHGYLPLCSDDGTIIGDGAIGRVTEDNVYLGAYAEYPSDDKRPRDLAVGERIKDVVFRLSGETGVYDIWRVQ